jgi:hypothetical protein
MRAMRYLHGVTTKRAIKEFCPAANVGVGTQVIRGEYVDNERDIRWITVPHNGSLWQQVENDGDWIVEKSPGHFFVYTDADFNEEFAR